jgi:pSer/pThr/pTyr-binding forkhead associated (FHA) protein
MSHTMMGMRAQVASAPPPVAAAPAPAPVPPPPPPAPAPSEPILGATRIVTMDEMGSASVQTGFFTAGDSPATMMVPVAVLVGPQNGDASGATATPHRLGSSTYIGRSEESHIRVQRPSVSRQHALVSAGPTGFSIQDLHSQNGTYINGERITEQATLQDGDRVTLGDAEFVFQFLKSDLAG